MIIYILDKILAVFYTFNCKYIILSGSIHYFFLLPPNNPKKDLLPDDDNDIALKL